MNIEEFKKDLIDYEVQQNAADACKDRFERFLDKLVEVYSKWLHCSTKSNNDYRDVGFGKDGSLFISFYDDYGNDFRLVIPGWVIDSGDDMLNAAKTHCGQLEIEKLHNKIKEAESNIEVAQKTREHLQKQLKEITHDD